MSKEQKELVEEIKETSVECNIKNLSEVKDWCPTGCTILDLAIANRYPGGIPLNRIVHIYGASGTCKSVLVTILLGYAQRKGMETYYADVEYSFDQRFAELLGIDVNKLNFGYPGTVEEFFDEWLVSILYKNISKEDKKKIDEELENDKPKKGRKIKRELNTSPKIVVVDSLTALPSILEKEKDLKDSKYGMIRAKQIGAGFRKYIREISDSNTTFIFIDQTRDEIGSFFGGETTSGGRARDFYPAVKIYLKHYRKVENSSGVVIGEWNKFTIEKNRIGPPFREGKFRLLYSYGLDDVSSNLFFLASSQSKGKVDVEEKMFKINLFGEERTRKAWIKHVEENDLEIQLREEVWRIWQEVYKEESRKSRIW